MSSPLALTRDPALLAELQRLAAAAGAELVATEDCAVALRSWTSAAVVLVGADLAEEMAALAPERREQVHVVSWGSVPDSLFRIALALGAVDVAQLPRSDRWLIELLADWEETTQDGAVIGVIGGSGGAGATVLACALGQVAAGQGEAVVIDTDPLGPGVDRMLGLEAEFGIRWDALQQTTGRLSARSFREALPRRDRVGALSWTPGADSTLQPFAIREALSAARRGHRTVIVDLPRQRGGLTEEVAARCDLVAVVAPASVCGVTSAERVCRWLDPHARIGVVLRGRGLIEEEVAAITGAPVLVSMGDQRGLDEAIDVGLGPLRKSRGPLMRAARAVLQAAG